MIVWRYVVTIVNMQEFTSKIEVLIDSEER